MKKGTLSGECPCHLSDRCTSCLWTSIPVTWNLREIQTGRRAACSTVEKSMTTWKTSFVRTG